MGKVEELTNLIETKHNEWKTLSINELRDISSFKRWVAETVLKKYRSDNDQTNNKTSKKKKSIPPQNTEEARFIDDPDELLISVAIRELNKPNPDSRWANILISCKKEKINIKSEVLDKFKQLPTKALVSLLSKSSQEEY